MNDRLFTHDAYAGIWSLLSKKPPNRMAARKHSEAITFAAATERAAAPTAMHMQLAHTLVAISVATNHARQYSVPSLSPTIW